MDTLSQLVQAFKAWLFGDSPPQRKKWCAAFYFVARQQNIGPPDVVLDAKLDQLVDFLTKYAVFDPAVFYVAYRAIWDATGRQPAFDVVPSTQSSFPPPASACLNNFTSTATDLPCFLTWLYTACPADHYAIFLWGHSFGPAGLFEPGGPIHIVPPLAALRAAFEQFRRVRLAGDPPPTAEAFVATVPQDEFEQVRTQISPAPTGPKVDIVLFQDCWMATLETADELKEEVDYVVASQSLLPTFSTGTGRWPYEELLHDLTTANFPVNMANRLVDYHDAHWAEITNLVSVPISVLKLDEMDNLVPKIQTLLASIGVVASTAYDRAPLFGAGQLLATAKGDLTAGDSALIDIPKLCTSLATHTDSSVSAAADSLLKMLQSGLIGMTREASRDPKNPLGFGGISALYVPVPGTEVDTYITGNLYKATYNNLQFVLDTGWPGTEQIP